MLSAAQGQWCLKSLHADLQHLQGAGQRCGGACLRVCHSERPRAPLSAGNEDGVNSPAACALQDASHALWDKLEAA